MAVRKIPRDEEDRISLPDEPETEGAEDLELEGVFQDPDSGAGSLEDAGSYEDDELLPRSDSEQETAGSGPGSHGYEQPTEGHGEPHGEEPHVEPSPDGTGIQFAFRAGGNVPYLVQAPVLDPETGREWVRERMESFRENPGSRESFEHKVKRKTLAAQGPDFEKSLRSLLDDGETMEWEMMVSPDSHHPPLDREGYEGVLAEGPAQVTVTADGQVVGEDDPSLSDSAGRTFTAQGELDQEGQYGPGIAPEGPIDYPTEVSVPRGSY